MAGISRRQLEVLAVLLLGVLRTIFAKEEQGGMKAKPFGGIPSIQEISCSGDPLESDVSVFAVELLDETKQLAQVNVMSKECTTSGSFSSCVIYENNSRRTTLKTLVMDLGPGESRSFFCEVTFLRTGEKTKSSRWRLDVKGWSASSSYSYTSYYSFSNNNNDDDDGNSNNNIVAPTTTRASGLQARPFLGSPVVQEVTCSGRVLEADAEVLSLVLLDMDSGDIVASAKPLSGQCTTSSRFSSCRIDSRDPRLTELSTLMLDRQQEKKRREEEERARGRGRLGQEEGEEERGRGSVSSAGVRSFGCEVTSARSGQRTSIAVWSLEVTAATAGGASCE